MNNNSKTVIKIFAFALFRINSLTDYLNEMRVKGYKLIKIRLGCILFFEPTKVRDDLKYVILSEEFHYNLDFEKQKFDDVSFMEKINARFHKGNGEQFDVVNRGVLYHIYLTAFFTSEDLEALKKHRKKYILRNNILWIIFYFWCFIFTLIMIILNALG